MKIPADLKLIYHDAKTFESSPSISNPSLVALIERIATLTEQLEQRDKDLAQARAELDSERAIVDRIWAIFGTPSYEELAGKSIYDLINGVIAERDALRAQLEQMRSPMTDEEFKEFAHKDDWGVDCVYVDGCNSILAARAHRQEKP